MPAFPSPRMKDNKNIQVRNKLAFNSFDTDLFARAKVVNGAAVILRFDLDEHIPDELTVGGLLVVPEDSVLYYQGLVTVFNGTPGLALTAANYGQAFRIFGGVRNLGTGGSSMTLFGLTGANTPGTVEDAASATLFPATKLGIGVDQATKSLNFTYTGTAAETHFVEANLKIAAAGYFG